MAITATKLGGMIILAINTLKVSMILTARADHKLLYNYMLFIIYQENFGYYYDKDPSKLWIFL